MNEQERIETLLHDPSGPGEQQVADLERKTLMSIEKKHRQIRRLRWVVVSVWIGLVALFVAGGVTEATAGRGVVTSTVAAIAQAMLLIALFLTVSLYVRSVSLRFAVIQQALAAIQDRLGQNGGDAVCDGR